MKQLSKSLIIIAATFATVGMQATVMPIAAHAQQAGSSAGYGGNDGNSHGGGAQPGDKGDLSAARISKAPIDPYYPPKYYYAPDPDADQTCRRIFNTITLQNMTVTVPRYNECVRRGGLE